MDFDAVYEQYAGWMYRLAFAVLRQPQDAEDAVQDAFLTLASKLDFYGSLSPERMKAALTVVTRSRAINILRKRKESADPEMMEQTLPGDSVSVTDGLLLQEAMAALPPASREIIILHYADGFTVPEIADLLGSKKEAVKKALYRARKRLHRFMEGEE